ncbi:effector-associated constant component EACC1 [Streptomyces sp. 7R007]
MTTPDAPAPTPAPALTVTFATLPPEDADVLVRDLAHWFDDDEDLREAVRLRSVPPPPGKLGGLATAVELLTATGPVLSAAVGAFGYWLGQRSTSRPVAFEVTLPDGTVTKLTSDQQDLDAALRAFTEFRAAGQPEDPAP